MKRFFLTLVFAAVIGVSASAQGKYGADSAECVKYLSYYKEFLKNNAIDEATPRWRKAYELCPPTANQNMLLDGQKILRNLIAKNSANSIYREALIDSLLTLHDVRIANYPTFALTARNNKSLDMINYVKDNNKLYNGLLENIRYTKENTNTSVFVFLMKTASDLYTAGSITAEDVMNVYGEIDGYINEAINETKAKGKSVAILEGVLKDVESLFIASNVASCDNLIALFTPRYQANPTDKDLLSNIVMMLSSAEDCTNNDLFLNASKSLDEIEPTHSSAFFLYRLYSSRNENDLAKEAMLKAIEREDSDSVQDAEYYLELGSFSYKKMNDRASAVEYAKKAIELNPQLAGKAYLLIGSIWGNTTCQGNDIEKRAPYWVAVDYLVKAKNADASLAETVDPMIATYSQYFPDQAEAFMFNVLDGDSYTVSCSGMRETTRVRTQK